MERRVNYVTLISLHYPIENSNTKWCMVAYGFYLCTLEMNKVHHSHKNILLV